MTADQNADLMKLIARLEELLICQHCGGEGSRPHKTLGTITCFQCNGTGNRLDDLIQKVNML